MIYQKSSFDSRRAHALDVAIHGYSGQSEGVRSRKGLTQRFCMSSLTVASILASNSSSSMSSPCNSSSCSSFVSRRSRRISSLVKTTMIGTDGGRMRWEMMTDLSRTVPSTFSQNTFHAHLKHSAPCKRYFGANPDART
jgi:hypothetical protein